MFEETEMINNMILTLCIIHVYVQISLNLKNKNKENIIKRISKENLHLNNEIISSREIHF
jgi:hypothetical protein